MKHHIEQSTELMDAPTLPSAVTLVRLLRRSLELLRRQRMNSVMRDEELDTDITHLIMEIDKVIGKKEDE